MSKKEIEGTLTDTFGYEFGKILVGSTEEPSISFNGKDGIELLKLCNNGNVYVGGRLTENDKEVVEAFRMFLRDNGYRV